MSSRFVWAIRLLTINLFLIITSLVLADSSAQLLPLPQGDWRDYQLVEGDIMMPLSAIEGRSTFEARKWIKGRVPYVFHSSVTPANQAKMVAAMNEWESVSGLDFLPRTTQPDYLEVINSGAIPSFPEGNWSAVGRVGGRQYLSIYNWDVHYIIMHELAHAAGVWHEQSRPDRNQYVTIVKANIYPGMERNFAIRNTARMVGEYDFSSIMHYDDTAFSVNGQPTIVAKPGYENMQTLMGNRNYLTTSDKQGMQIFYPEQGDTHKTAVLLENNIATQTVTAFTEGYTIGGREPVYQCVDSVANIDKTIWFKITPTYDSGLSITSSGSYDTALFVYTGNPSQWVSHACANKESLKSWNENVMVNAKAGQTYYIVVGYGGGQALGFSLNLKVDSYRNLLQNGDFEWGKTGWTIRHVPTNLKNDKILCIKNLEIPTAYGSRCSFKFVGGSGEATSISQNIPAKNFRDVTPAIGDMYLLRFNAGAGGSNGKLHVLVQVTYKDGSKQALIAQDVNIATGAMQYYGLTGVLSRADVKKFTVTIINLTSDGQTIWLDSLQLRPQTPMLHDESSTSSVLTLP